MQPAVPAMPAGFEMIFKPHRLGATQHAGEEGSDRSQQAAAERLPDDQQRDESSSHLFHQPGHEVVSVVSEDAAPSSHQQEHAVGVSHTGEDGLHALHAGPGAFRHARVVQQQGGVDDWDESSFGDMCRRLVAVTEVLQVADAASLASALCHFFSWQVSSCSSSFEFSLLQGRKIQTLLLCWWRPFTWASDRFTEWISMLHTTLLHSFLFSSPCTMQKPLYFDHFWVSAYDAPHTTESQLAWSGVLSCGTLACHLAS